MKKAVYSFLILTMVIISAVEKVHSQELSNSLMPLIEGALIMEAEVPNEAQMQVLIESLKGKGQLASIDSSCKPIEIGHPDLKTYVWREIDFPECLDRGAGGYIRLIMRHEITDQLRMMDLLIGIEQSPGKHPGRHGFTLSGGAFHEWVLGNGRGENLADPFRWAWITDYRWLQDYKEIPGEKIRIYSHPHVTTTAIFYTIWP